MFVYGVGNNIFCYFTLICVQTLVLGYWSDVTQDQTSSRPNTLMDDADDIQRQLDNEARDRIKYGRPKTIWLLHFSTKPTIISHVKGRSSGARKASQSLGLGEYVGAQYSFPEFGSNWEWDYKDQDQWYKKFPECGRRSQSPVDIPVTSLVKTRGARQTKYCNYKVMPQELNLHIDGRRLTLFGLWRNHQRPLIYGGAAHSRRYLFHSLMLHCPSEHTIGGLQYPLESQAIHVAAEYGTLDEAMNAIKMDPQAFLGVANVYKFSNRTQKGLKHILDTAFKINTGIGSLSPQPLIYFSPPLKEYASYYGSLTAPPCSEAVLWLVNARALPVERKTMKRILMLFPEDTMEAKTFSFRQVQPLNDRKVYFFKT